MVSRLLNIRSLSLFAGFLVVFSAAQSMGYAQRGAAPGPPPTPTATAAIDLTGTWVPLVTEDWRVRMVTPKKGDYESVPLTAEGRRVADTWDPAKDEAAGEQCKSYGAPSLLRVPGRIRISWENDNTIKIDTEAGTQTRRLTFGAVPAAAEPSLQGTSVATWENVAGGRGNQPRTGNLRVVTRNLRPGYLRRNGVPYSNNAVVNETYDRVTSPNRDQLLVIVTEVVDPLYLNQTFVTSTHFKKLPDNAAFTPEPCSAR